MHLGNAPGGTPSKIRRCSSTGRSLNLAAETGDAKKSSSLLTLTESTGLRSSSEENGSELAMLSCVGSSVIVLYSERSQRCCIPSVLPNM